ncbi:hypothetical protein L218DRAFT_798304, partial [Marasmius fiardii PR-910]
EPAQLTPTGITPESWTTAHPINNASLLTVLAAGRLRLDLETILQSQYANDVLFKKVLENPKDFWNFEIDKGLIYLKLKDRKVLCVPRVIIGDRNIREYVIDEAHSLLAHLGPKKTLDYLQDYLWWK